MSTSATIDPLQGSGEASAGFLSDLSATSYIGFACCCVKYSTDIITFCTTLPVNVSPVKRNSGSDSDSSHLPAPSISEQE